MLQNPHVYELLIRESHLDTFGHVNNAVYLEIFEQARWDLITANGYGLDQIIASNLGPVILEVNVKFRREVHLRETVRIETRIVEYKKKIGKLEQKMVNSRGEVASEALFTWGLFDTVQRKLVEPTPAWLRAVGMPEKSDPF